MVVTVGDTLAAMLPTGDGAYWSLLSHQGVSDVVRSLSFVMFVHLSELQFEFFVRYLRKKEASLIAAVINSGLVLSDIGYETEKENKTI